MLRYLRILHYLSIMTKLLSRILAWVRLQKQVCNIEDKPLGRWKIHHDGRAFDKADLTSADHCGCCGDILLKERQQHALKKIEGKAR